ncbi:MAG TPA: PQQ-binding-like beta-propeller repeat protein [Streptosporangiaceae bacterium]|jgi:outer membrane protein assembly factor BamB
MRFTVRLATSTTAFITAAALALAPVTAGSAAPRPAPPTGTANWPQFHFNAAHTGYNPAETTIGPSNVSSLKLLWARYDGQGSSFSSVSVDSGRVLLGTLGDSVLRAWGAVRGGLQWSAQASNGLESTAAVGGGRAFVESDGGTLYAFNTKTGALLWSQSTGGAATSPTLVNGVVYAAGYFTMNAFDASTGAPLWSTGLPGLVRSVPAVADGKVFVSDESNSNKDATLVALDASTGATLWRGNIHDQGFAQLASPVVGGGKVYLCTSAGLYAFGAAAGFHYWFTPEGCDDNTTPALAQGVLYTDANSQTWAFSASTGALLWSAGSGGGDGPPAVANGVLYVTTAAGTIQAYDVATHALLWTSQHTGSGESGPAVVNGAVYVGGNNGVYAFGLPS